MINYYAIFDRSLNLSNAPFVAPDDKSAIRLVRNMLLASDDGVVSRVAKDCDIRFVGFYNEETCSFVPREKDHIVIDLSAIPLPDKEVDNEL